MGGMNNAPPRGPAPGPRRRRRPMGRMNGAAEKRRGLEVLRDLQQVGVWSPDELPVLAAECGERSTDTAPVGLAMVDSSRQWRA